MTRAEQLANDLHRQLELVEWERDEAVRERDEAHATIDAVKKVREDVLADRTAALVRYSDDRDPMDLQVSITLGFVGGRLDMVDGL